MTSGGKDNESPLRVACTMMTLSGATKRALDVSVRHGIELKR
jgi:hypothetical protein